MAFVKRQGFDPLIDYWVDIERDVLTVVADASAEEIAILFYSDPDTITKQEILEEMQALYPTRPVNFSRDTDKYQDALRKMGFGVIPHEERQRQREVIVVGGRDLYYSHFLKGGEPTQFRQGMKLRPLEPRKPPPVSAIGINRKGKPAKHWER